MKFYKLTFVFEGGLTRTQTLSSFQLLYVEHLHCALSVSSGPGSLLISHWLEIANYCPKKKYLEILLKTSLKKL